VTALDIATLVFSREPLASTAVLTTAR